MTLSASQADGAGATNTAVLILAGPSSGTHTIACSVSNSGGIFAGQATSWLGVNQATPNRTAVSNNGSSGSPASVAVTNAQSGDLVIDTVSTYINGTLAVGLSQTQRYNQEQYNIWAGSSSKVATGSTTMQWTGTSWAYWAEIAVALIAG
jgi:hypothetical protein